MIKLTKIESEHVLKCPGCGHARLAATANSLSVPGGGHWLYDGDLVQGLHETLVRANLEKAIPENDPDAWHLRNYEASGLFGHCPACMGTYFVVEVAMIDASVTVDLDFVESYFRENYPIPQPTNFVAKNNELGWLTCVHSANKGVTARHIFGPFELVDDDDGVLVSGAGLTGKCPWEFGRKFLLQRWPELKALAVEINAPAARNS